MSLDWQPPPGWSKELVRRELPSVVKLRCGAASTPPPGCTGFAPGNGQGFCDPCNMRQFGWDSTTPTEVGRDGN